MGRRISGGQKQRIGIARALYNNSNFIIFDEATSAIDNLTEMKIYRNIEKYFPNKTIIVITHRVNTIKKFDQIIFLNSGKIDEVGSYEYLAKNNSNFQMLIKNYV
jgi:HlyD family secretion protein